MDNNLDKNFQTQMGLGGLEGILGSCLFIFGAINLLGDLMGTYKLIYLGTTISGVALFNNSIRRLNNVISYLSPYFNNSLKENDN